MNVYNKKIKNVIKDVKVIQPCTWAQAKVILKNKNLTKNVLNWSAHLLMKKSKRKEKTLYQFYLKKVLQKRPLQKRLLKNVSLE